MLVCVSGAIEALGGSVGMGLTHMMTAHFQLYHPATLAATLPAILGGDAEDLLRSRVFGALLVMRLGFAEYTGLGRAVRARRRITLDGRRGYEG